MYKSSHFLDETLLGKISDDDCFRFSLTPKITERIAFPFNTANFYSVKFNVTSPLLLNPEERFTRQLYSALLFVGIEEVIFPDKKVLHKNPEQTMTKLSFYN